MIVDYESGKINVYKMFKKTIKQENIIKVFPKLAPLRIYVSPIPPTTSPTPV